MSVACVRFGLYMPKIRDKGLSEVNITLPQLLTYGRTLEATVQQAKIMSDAASNGTSVHAVSHDSQSFSSKQGDYGTPRFRASRVQGKSGSHRDHQVAGPSYDKPHYKQHQGKPPHWMSAKSCPGCGGQPHNRLKCKAWGKTCRKCHKENHFASVCRSKEAHFKENYSTNDLCEDAYTLSLHHTTGNHTVKPYECTVSMAGKVVCLEIDTGASVSLISEREWGMIIESAPQLTLDTNNVPCLRTYAGNPIKPLGKIRLNVYHNNQQHKLPVLVVPGVGPNLLGRDWLSVLKLDWARVFKVDTDDLLRPYQEVFSDGLGALKVSDASYHKIVAVNQDGDNSKSSTYFEVQRLLRELTRARQASEHSQGWADFLERELLVHINARIAAEESHERTLRRPSNTRLANKRAKQRCERLQEELRQLHTGMEQCVGENNNLEFGKKAMDIRRSDYDKSTTARTTKEVEVNEDEEADNVIRLLDESEPTEGEAYIEQLFAKDVFAAADKAVDGPPSPLFDVNEARGF